MRTGVDPSWKEIFDLNGLKDFEDLWHGRTAFASPVACGSDGNVIRLWLRLPNGGQTTVFVKRREDPAPTGFRKFFSKPLPLQSEVTNAGTLGSLGISTPKVLWFESKSAEGKIRSVLVTEGLDSFISLQELLTAWRRPALLDHGRRKMITESLSKAVRRMHDASIVHQDLAPEHVFVRFDDTEAKPKVEIGLVDLERCGKTVLSGKAGMHELINFDSRVQGVTNLDRLRFLRGYLSEGANSGRGRKMIRRLRPIQRAGRNP